MQTLAQLLEMKSTDRKQTLLHYLVKVIAEKYPQLSGFHSDLHFLDKAGSGNRNWVFGGWRIGPGAFWCCSLGEMAPSMSLERVASDSMLFAQCLWTVFWPMCAACSEAWSWCSGSSCGKTTVWYSRSS